MVAFVGANNYLRKGTGEVQKRIADELPYTIDIEVASGNDIGLNPALEFNYTIKLHDDGFIPGEPVVLVFGRTSVRVEDLDGNLMMTLFTFYIISCDSGA